MTDTQDIPLPALSGWAIILGASTGFGEAIARKLAQVGVNIIGVHLDRRAMQPQIDKTIATIREFGREAWYFNINAADADRRNEVLDEVERRFAERKQGEQVRVFVHSLAFGTLRRFVHEEPAEEVTQKQVEMTLDVMAHSLVYWTQGLMRRKLLSHQGRIYAMTSTGSKEVWDGYGAVSAAKAALEAHCRQLAFELGPLGITANALCAGVTETAASSKIPNFEVIRDVALRKNPSHRLTVPDDVANALVALAQPSTYWLNGNVLYVDGGEAHSG